MPVRNKERHRTERIGWLRAAVLGANDGILSTSSLVPGFAAAHIWRANLESRLALHARRYVTSRKPSDRSSF